MQRIEIRIRGQIDGDWSDWLGGMTVTPTADGETVLSGQVNDQSALFGLLKSLSRLGLRIVSISYSDSVHERQGKEVIGG